MLESSTSFHPFQLECFGGAFFVQLISFLVEVGKCSASAYGSETSHLSGSFTLAVTAQKGSSVRHRSSSFILAF